MINWKHLPVKVILDVVEVCDGHTIFKLDAFTKLGVPQELVDRYSDEFESDTSDYKSTIFDDHGKVIPKMKGVYGLEVIESINREFGLPAPDKFGRGSRAVVCRDQIKKYLGEISTK
jgi:hypothetical protein